MNQTSRTTGNGSDLLEMLDEGMLRLRPADREAVALRFLQGNPLSQVGEALGVSEDAARKRVERGLEKLRRFFQDRGIQTNPGALAAVLASGTNAPPVSESLTSRIAQAARTPHYSSVLLLHPKALAAAFLLVCGALGVVGWAIFAAPSTQSSADATPSSAASTPAPVSPTTAPAAKQPGADFSTPDATLATYCHALERADRAAAIACLLTDPNRPATLLDVSLHEELARRRMILSAERRYGAGADNLVDSGMMVTPILEGMILLRQLSGETAIVTGNTATIAVRIPDAIIRSVNNQEVRDSLLLWSGKPLYFQFHDRGWRIDLNRSAQYVLFVYDPKSATQRDPGDAKSIAILEALSEEYDAIATQIDAGGLPQLADAQDAARGVVGRVCDKFGIGGINSYPVPAEFAKP